MLASIGSFFRKEWEYAKAQPWWYWAILIAIVMIVPGWIIWGLLFVVVTYALFGKKKPEGEQSDSDEP